MEKIRVVHFVDRINRGGTQAVLYEWLKNRDRTKVDFDFLTFMDSRDEYVEEYKKLGCNIYRLSDLSISSLPKFQHELNAFFKSHSYDVAHGHSKSKNFLFLLAAKQNGVKVRIAHSHNTEFHRMKFVGECVKPLLKLVATDFFACSELAGKWLFGEAAVKNNKVTIINNGVDVGRFRFNEESRLQVRENLSLGENHVYGHVGRYMTQKNHGYLIDIFREIKRLDASARFLLVGIGDKTIHDMVDEKIRDYGLTESVLQLGMRKDVNELMQAMDVFIMPSLHEGLPVVGIEAQAAGLPCLFSDKITREVGLLPSTQFISIDEDPRIWAEKAVAAVASSIERKEASAIVDKCGYDSKAVSEFLLKQYCEKVEKYE